MLEVEVRTLKGHPPRDITVGTISLDDSGKLVGRPAAPEHERIIRNILRSPIMPGGKRIDPAVDALGWIQGLYLEYRSYLRCTKPVEKKEFHLPGQHIQDTHGNWAAGSNPAASPGGQYPLPGVKPSEVVVNPQRFFEKTALVSGEITSEEDLGGGANATEKIEIDTPKGKITAVFKPAAGEVHMTYDVPRGEYYLREAAASDLAEILGLEDLVPSTEIREIKGRVGSAQVFRNDEFEVARNAENPMGVLSETTIGRAAAFDYLIGNIDRHQGNWLVDEKNGRVVLIDHGFSLPVAERAVYSNFTYYAMNRGLSITEAIGDSWDDKWTSIEMALRKRSLSNDAIRLAKTRYDNILAVKHSGGSFAELSWAIDGY